MSQNSSDVCFHLFSQSNTISHRHNGEDEDHDHELLLMKDDIIHH